MDNRELNRALIEDSGEGGTRMVGCITIAIILVIAGALLIAVLKNKEKVDQQEEVRQEMVDSLYQILVGEDESILEDVKGMLHELHNLCHTLSEMQHISPEECHSPEWPHNGTLQAARR